MPTVYIDGQQYVPVMPLPLSHDERSRMLALLAERWTQEDIDEARDTNNAEVGETFRQTLMGLLLKVWIEQESFNGKRPWGNSGWDHGFYVFLVLHGYAPGRRDNDGDLEYDEVICEEVMQLVIRVMCEE